MKIKTAAHFVGPNIFSAQPVNYYRISGLKKLRSTEIDSAARDQLLQLLPHLGEAPLSCEAAEFFAAKDAEGRLPIGHAIEHVALALQNQAGTELTCARTDPSGPIDSRSAIVPFEELEVCEAAVALSFDLIERLVSTNPDSTRGASKKSPNTDEFPPRIESFLVTAARRMLPVQDRSFVRAARDRDVPTHRIAGRIVQLGQGVHQHRVSATKTTRTNVVSNDLAANKDFSRRILGRIGLPIPRYERVYRSRDALKAARQIGFPVVVKPNQGNMGQAVSVGMRTSGEVSAAYKRAREIDRSILVEELIDGDDFRVLVIDGQFCAASKRTPGHVVGDGVSSIEELVVKLNADPRRGSGPRSPWTRLEFDDQADRLLADLDMTRSSVPLEGETVYLRRNANTSDGGTAMDVTDSVHPENREIAVRAARAIGLDIAGVDFLTKDISRSMWRTGGVICEINSRPGLRKHMWPADGPARDIMTPIVDMLYPKGQPSRIPVVGILGIDRGAGRNTAQLLSHLLESSGRRVGLAVNHRVSINGAKSRTGRMNAPDAAQTILFDPDVDVAVLELTVNDVVRDGLGCDAFDVSLIVSKRSEKPEASGPEGQSIPAKVLDAIRVFARTTRRALVAEGDDALIAAVRAEDGPAEFVDVRNEDATPKKTSRKNADPEKGMEAEMNSPETQRAADLASRVATRLGVSQRELRRGLRSFDPKTGRRKARASKKKRAESASTP
jgi:cyanophycin synthetase